MPSSIAVEAHVAAALSLCNPGKKGFPGKRQSKVRADPQQIVLSSVDIESGGEQELFLRDDETADSAEILPQIIVPNIDTHPAEDALSEVVDAELDELDTEAEREEVRFFVPSSRWYPSG